MQQQQHTTIALLNSSTKAGNLRRGPTRGCGVFALTDKRSVIRLIYVLSSSFHFHITHDFAATYAACTNIASRDLILIEISELNGSLLDQFVSPCAQFRSC